MEEEQMCLFNGFLPEKNPDDSKFEEDLFSLKIFTDTSHEYVDESDFNNTSSLTSIDSDNHGLDLIFGYGTYNVPSVEEIPISDQYSSPSSVSSLDDLGQLLNIDKSELFGFSHSSALLGVSAMEKSEALRTSLTECSDPAKSLNNNQLSFSKTSTMEITPLTSAVCTPSDSSSESSTQVTARRKRKRRFDKESRRERNNEASKKLRASKKRHDLEIIESERKEKERNSELKGKLKAFEEMKENHLECLRKSANMSSCSDNQIKDRLLHLTEWRLSVERADQSLTIAGEVFAIYQKEMQLHLDAKRVEKIVLEVQVQLLAKQAQKAATEMMPNGS